MKESLKRFIVSVAVGLLSAAFYLPALNYGFVIWDDNRYVFENPHILHLDMDFFRWAFFGSDLMFGWLPLTYLSHAIDYRFWGLNPLGHHLTSIIMHGLNSGLIAFLAALLLNESYARSGNRQDTYPKAFLAAAISGLLFGLHPVHVEAAAWVTARKDLLSSFFVLTSAIAYIYYARRVDAAGGKSFAGMVPYSLSLSFFLLSLMSKQTTVMFPFALVVLDWYPLRRRLDLKNLMEKVPFIIFALLVGIYTLTIYEADDSQGRFLSQADMVSRAAMLWLSSGFYIWRTVIPYALLPHYPFIGASEVFSTPYVYYECLAIGITVISVWFAGKGKRILLSAWGFYLIMLLPLTGSLFGVIRYPADRYAYLPEAGIFILGGVAIANAVLRPGRISASVHRLSTVVLAMTVISSFSVLTIRQMTVWSDTEALWRHEIQYEPERVPTAYLNLGIFYYSEVRLDEALRLFLKTIELDPGNKRAHFCLATVYGDKQEYENALVEYEASLDNTINDAEAHANMGDIYFKLGDYEKSLSHLSGAIDMDGGDPDYFVKRAHALQALGLYRKAAEDYLQAVALGSADGDIRLNLTECLEHLDRG